MQLSIKPHTKDTYPLSAVLIKGNNMHHWVKEIQFMKLDLLSLNTYILPGNTPNSIYGCLVVHKPEIKISDLRSHTRCQFIHGLLFIPEKSVLFPRITEAEAVRIFNSKLHIFHPEFGLAELEHTVDWNKYLAAPLVANAISKQPLESVTIPSLVKSFQVKAVSPEQALEELDQKAFPKSEKFDDKPLSSSEKRKLDTYKKYFKRTKNANGEYEISTTPAFERYSWWRNLFSKKDSTWKEDMVQEYEDLEYRNQKNIDKLLDLFEKNPDEALKYAIPLDEGGTNRGPDGGLLDFSKRWNDFGLWSQVNSTGGGGGSTIANEQYQKLQEQYRKAAEDLIRKKEYHKAAFIYLKLLKYPLLAAQTLENGKLYQDAASIYIKHLNDKNGAARCYESGNMILEAIEMHKDLNNHEKVGDLYVKLKRKGDAYKYYDMVADSYKQNGQYIKASLIYKYKMEDPMRGQDILLMGWCEGKDAYNCLNNYFANIPDVKLLHNQINQVYRNHVNDHNKEQFLQVMKLEYQKHKEIAAPIRELAYEIVVSRIDKNPGIAEELKAFNEKNTLLGKDLSRFRTRKNNFLSGLTGGILNTKQ